MIFSSKKQTEKINVLEKQLEESKKTVATLQAELQKEREKNRTLLSEIAEVKSAGEKQAKQKAEVILEEARQKYEKEITRLRIFVEKWQSALPEPKEATPESRKRRALAVALSEILKDNPCNSNLEEGVKLLEKLTNAINGGNAEDGGFNLEEVLNPGSDLDLATLCKELGVMD